VKICNKVVTKYTAHLNCVDRHLVKYKSVQFTVFGEDINI